MKGGMVIGLFMLLVVLVVFSALIDEITTQISNALPFLSTSSQTIIQLIPLAIIIVLLSLVLKGKMDD